jgi:apolipoprotein N-acyltransferase
MPRRPPGGRAPWLAGYVVVTFLAFPHPFAGRVVDLGWLLAWASPAALLVAVSGLPPRRAALLGFAAGLVAHAGILHWIWVVTVVYGHAHPLLGLLGPIGLGAYVAAFCAAFAAGASALGRARLASPYALAALWTALDHLRSFALTGFPWATLGYAQHLNGALMGLAPYTGVYGLCFVTALGGAALARCVLRGRAGWGGAAGAAGALGVVVVAHVLGLALRTPEPRPGADTLRVAVLQGNIDQGVKWSRDWYERTLGIYEDLTRRAVARGAELVVWPETAVPGGLGSDGSHSERLAALAREAGAELVVGAVGVDLDAAAGTPRYYDSAFVLDRSGRITDRYDKSHLVPFGEYVPFQELIGRLLKAVARGIATTGVTAGPGPRPLRIEPPGAGPLTAGVAICYELLFPDVVRRFVRDGAEVLLAITNDAWYGRTGAPYQFLAITALRAAENRVWTARAANTGVSAIIDARGRVRERTRIFERDLLVAEVPRRPAPLGGSFYARWGDVFAAACWAGVAVLGVAARVRSGAARASRSGDE